MNIFGVKECVGPSSLDALGFKGTPTGRCWVCFFVSKLDDVDSCIVSQIMDFFQTNPPFVKWFVSTKSTRFHPLRNNCLALRLPWF